MSGNLRQKSTRCILGALAMVLMISLRVMAADYKDSKAVEIAKTMEAAMGGLNMWQQAHFIRYDFIVKQGSKTLLDRSHLWDKQTGRYRLEEKTRDGKPEVVLFNINTKEGSAYIGGKKAEGVEAEKAVTDAYAAFVNDSWWLDMPWGWLNDGVNLKYLGPKKRGQETDDVVELTFNHVGLTPGDMYHAFVSRHSHLMTHWDYVLQSHQKGSWDWEYTESNGIKLASNHRSAGGKMTINMGNVSVLDSVDEDFFTNPSHTLSQFK
jgi:hypothetical protein